ncbi:MAG: acetyl-CoA acetyltransferase [Anaerolineaceae bacterium 4572_32.1]|nr:MAG: acetyl-CoA acetyltransferase [Anaerolineaceae bacterium 4572_32.1]
MDQVVIVSAARTAIGSFQGTLSTTPAPQLGAVAIRGAVERAAIDPATVDEVLMGCVVPAGQGQAPARQAAIHSGLPASVGAVTLNKVCGSGMKTIMLAAAMIRAGDAEIVVAGGMENMSLGPYLLPKARSGYRLGHGQILDATVHDGLWCSFDDVHMGNAAEFIAGEYDLTREELDAYALDSQRKAVAAIDAGRFEAEIVPLKVPQRRGDPIIFDTDEAPRRDTSLEKLARLRPAFQKGGIVTAGNAPGITDGAAAVIVMSGSKAGELGLKPLARITGYAQAAVEPGWVFIAPAHAVRRLLIKTATALADYDLIEINEAFAAQTLADGKELEKEGWDWDKVNVNGGAIALGHPIGCSGTRVLVTLLYALQARGLKTGLATLCLGGGEAVAMSVEML